MIQAKASEKGLKLKTVIDPNLPALVQGDATRVSQALLNYLGNALKFTEQGEIILTLEQLATEGKKIEVRFAVSDTGIGIDRDAMSRLFQNFEQADNSTTRKFGGSGLGLSITRHLAKMMGGETGAQSQPKIGSEFWFTATFECAQSIATGFPISSALSPDALLTRDFKGTRVLVCEDNPINQEIIAELLADVGFVVDVAENGAVAIAMAAQTTYRLILMDMQMPVVDGLEATQELRLMSGYARTPIVAMTANAFETDREACLLAGMDQFVTKPVNPDALFQLLYGLLNRRRS
jgi:CheY-like chemotaxis protein